MILNMGSPGQVVLKKTALFICVIAGGMNTLLMLVELIPQ